MVIFSYQNIRPQNQVKIPAVLTMSVGGGETMDDFEIELKKDFLCEAIDLLEVAEGDFLALEKDPQNKELIDAIFRFAHNLKGTSRAVGLGEIAEITHLAENLLLNIKEDKLLATPRVVSVLLAFKDQVSTMIEGLSQDLSLTFDCSQLIGDLEEVSKEDFTATAPEQVVIVEEETETTILEPTFISPKKEPRREDETIRVSLGRLEKLNDLVGELVILRSVIESTLQNHGESKTAR